MNDITAITAPQDIDRIIAAVAQIAPWLLPLYRAVRAKEINLITPYRGATIRKTILADARRPCIVLIGDDDYRSTGPEGWPCARRVKAWSAQAIVHAAGGEQPHYEAAVTAATACSRLLLVETSSACRDAWLAFLAPKPVHLIATRGADTQPARMTPENTH